MEKNLILSMRALSVIFATLILASPVLSTLAFGAQPNGLPDLSQLPPGSNNMFGNVPPATYQASPQANQQTGGDKALPPADAAAIQRQLQQMIQQQQATDSQKSALPFDPSQFQQINPSQGSRPSNVNARPKNKEEPFVPSEVISVLPPAQKTAEIRAVLRTSMGDVTIKLDKQHAPQTVNHFVALAKGDKEFIDSKTSKRVRRPFYTDLIFHRVVKGYLIQTGCPFGTGRGGPGDIATIKDETGPTMKFNRAGLVAMAPLRDANGTGLVKDTNGSQFFITLREMPEWDDKFTIFGVVEEGMDVIQKIASVNVGPTERPIKRVLLKAVDIYEGTADQQMLMAPSDAAPAK